MITKTTTPILENSKLIGTRCEYRLFGVLLCRKELITPEKYDLKEYNNYYTSI